MKHGGSCGCRQPFRTTPSPVRGRRHAERQLSKRLIFSTWQVVPKAVAGVVSYDVERRIFPTLRPLRPLGMSIRNSARGAQEAAAVAAIRVFAGA